MNEFEKDSNFNNGNNDNATNPLNEKLGEINQSDSDLPKFEFYTPSEIKSDLNHLSEEKKTN